MIIYDKNNELMELEFYNDIIKRGFCCIEGKQLKDFRTCPICNFDDDGKICVPNLCEDFVKIY